MKKSLILTAFFMMAIMAVAVQGAVAQENQDKVTMLNGEEHIGKVTGMDATSIQFVHQNESLSYTYQKADINKIQFASGRIEVINKVQKGGSGGGAQANLQDHHNKVAVLPFTYMSSGGDHDDAMEKKVQSDCYNVLTKFADQFQIQDPTTTNAMLIKHGVNTGNIDGFTPAELCDVLGVEYVVMGTVSVMYTGTVNSSGSSTTSQRKNENKTIKFTSSSSSSTDNFKTQVDMKIYSDQGQNIFAKSHNSFWQTEDAYSITLQWLIKRSPLYMK